MRKLIKFILLGLLLLAGCSSPAVKQTYFYPPEVNSCDALDSLASVFSDLQVDQLDEFFCKWEEVSARITSSRPLCELDSIVRFVWEHYSYLELRSKDTSSYITMPVSIKVYYFDGMMSGLTYGGPFWRRSRSSSSDQLFYAKDTLTMKYTPVLSNMGKPVLYINRSIYQLFHAFVVDCEDRVDVLRSYIPVSFMMFDRHFVSSIPDIYEIHFYENGIMVDSQLWGTYETEEFFPSDGSPSYEVGGLIQ